MRQPTQDMAEQIFIATERLMAKDGLQNLSMHKIARETQISAGTIYLYFKNKDELLAQFALRVFSNFQQQLAKDINQDLDFFQQYRQMWLNIWHYLLNNPMIVSNMYQYQALPGFYDIVKQSEGKSRWDLFCKEAQKAGVLSDLPCNVLFSLGLESALKLAYKQQFFNEPVDETMLEFIIERTWRAIQK